jgi:hypothetical protein
VSRAGGWICTASGREFWPLDPRPEEVDIEDIAHALSRACRFAGHCSRLYTVGEHSILVASWVPPEDALWGLLHDAAEAYLPDMPRPLKRLPEFAWYRAAERRVMDAVCDRFGLPRAEPQSVKAADLRALATEARDLMPPRSVTRWGSIAGVEPYPDDLKPECHPDVTREAFLDAFRVISSGTGERPDTAPAGGGT